MNAIDLRLLPPYARLLFQVLPRLAKGHDDCLCGNKRLAEEVGCCESTIRNCLAALQNAGLIEIVRDYGLRTRRRIVLLWRKASERFPSMVINKFGHSTNTFSTACASPPIRVSEEDLKEREGEAAAAASIEKPKPKPTPSPAAKPAAPVPDPELVAKAAKVFRIDLTDAERIIRREAKRAEAAWIAHAIDTTGAVDGKKGLTNPSRFFFAVLNCIVAKGGPDPIPAPRPMPNVSPYVEPRPAPTPMSAKEIAANEAFFASLLAERGITPKPRPAASAATPPTTPTRPRIDPTLGESLNVPIQRI